MFHARLLAFCWSRAGANKSESCLLVVQDPSDMNLVDTDLIFLETVSTQESQHILLSYKHPKNKESLGNTSTANTRNDCITEVLFPAI